MAPPHAPQGLLRRPLRLAAGRSAAIAVALAASLVLASTAVSPAAHAEPPLPYRAYGSGLRAGQTVEALNGGRSVATTRADSRGNWWMDIAADRAASGDTITFTLDGAATGASVRFAFGQFPAPPGLRLVDGAAAAPTQAATPAPWRMPTPAASAPKSSITACPPAGAGRVMPPVCWTRTSLPWRASR